MLRLLLGVALSALATCALAETPASAQPEALRNSARGAPTAPAPKPGAVGEVVVTARRLTEIRTGIQTQLGASTYVIDRKAIEVQPGAASAGLNAVVLQAPGVVQDSFGELHVRGEHGDLQYRLNGVILPEGLAAFGQVLNTRLAEKVDLITGALPAEYGLENSGIIDITVRSGARGNGGALDVYGGSQGRLQTSLDYAGRSGPWNGFGSVDWRTSGVGIESPDARSTPLHDTSHQARAFGYLERDLDDSSRLTFIGGYSQASFQIPNRSGNRPTLGYVVSGVSDFRSEDLNETQRERTGFAVLSYLRTFGDVDLQASVFGRYSSLDFRPDLVGDLLFTGIAQRAFTSSTQGGLQVDGVWHAGAAHTVRGGVLLQGERASVRTDSSVLPVDAAGAPTTDRPLVVRGRQAVTGGTYSLYLQDEWKVLSDLVLNYGLRFDATDLPRAESQLSPRLNAVWTPRRGLTLHAGYARYFTTAPFTVIGSETVAAFQNTSAAPPGDSNDAPRAERADYFDVGVSQRVTPQLTLGLDTYLKRTRYQLDQGQFGAPIIQTSFNYERGLTYGVELTADYRRGPFSAYANVAYSRARARNIISSQFNFDPGDLAYIAGHYVFVDHDQTWTASAGAAYRLGRTTISADMLYGSGLRAEGDVPNGRALPDYVQVNAALSQGLELPRLGALDVRLEVANLFDEVYLIRNGTGVGVGQPQYGPRRGVFVGLTKRF